MKNDKLVEILKKEYDPSSKVVIHLHFSSGVAEKNVVTGYWNGDYVYSMECTQYWKRGNLVTKYNDVSDLIELLSKKNVSELTHKDFTDIELEETVNGYLELDKITWDKPKPTKKMLDDEGFNYNDLYSTGDITDCEYEFDAPDSLFVELRNNRDSLNIMVDGSYKFIKGPRVKRWTKANQQQFQGEYISAINKLAELHGKYELILEEGLTQNLPNVSDLDIKELSFQFDGVKVDVDSYYKKWQNEPLQLTITNEFGAKFVVELSDVKSMIKLRNELIKKIDSLIIANDASENDIEEAWETEESIVSDWDIDTESEDDNDDFSNWDHEDYSPDGMVTEGFEEGSDTSENTELDEYWDLIDRYHDDEKSLSKQEKERMDELEQKLYPEKDSNTSEEEEEKKPLVAKKAAKKAVPKKK